MSRIKESLGSRLPNIIESLREFPMKMEILVHGMANLNRADADVRETIENHTSDYVEMNEAWVSDVAEEYGYEASEIAVKIVVNRAMIAMLKLICTRVAQETQRLESNLSSYRYQPPVIRLHSSDNDGQQALYMVGGRKDVAIQYDANRDYPWSVVEIKNGRLMSMTPTTKVYIDSDSAVRAVQANTWRPEDV